MPGSTKALAGLDGARRAGWAKYFDAEANYLMLAAAIALGDLSVLKAMAPQLRDDWEAAGRTASGTRARAWGLREIQALRDRIKRHDLRSPLGKLADLDLVQTILWDAVYDKHQTDEPDLRTAADWVHERVRDLEDRVRALEEEVRQLRA